ncbi:hypothetical protein QFC19_007760 [Naganishia cerealis]|uniref:Uncharacterized protein n=1 Tax=Naganishia cerealis TaxID=610337 RepID=A0ACC2V7D5_9TREE|nr:hypothetical protein QFC19_007760 [Naganishia cerealis]
MLKTSCSLLKQASYRGSAQIAVYRTPSRALSTSLTRLAEHADDKEDSKLSKMQQLLLEVPPELGIDVTGLGSKSDREQHESKQTRKPYKRMAKTSQTYGNRTHSPSAPVDPYAVLQNIRPPRTNRPPRSNDDSRTRKSEGQSGGRTPSAEAGQRQTKGPRAHSQSGADREARHPARGERNGSPRAESSRKPQNDRASRPQARDPAANTSEAPRQSALKPAVRAAPTVEELFGDLSMLSEQSGAGNEVSEGHINVETSASKNSTQFTNLDLLPPSPVVPQSLTSSTPRQQIIDFAVLQADYTLSRNPNVSLDQRGQAIGLVRQRLGA